MKKLLDYLRAKIATYKAFCRYCGRNPVEPPDQYCSEDCYQSAVWEDQAA